MINRIVKSPGFALWWGCFSAYSFGYNLAREPFDWYWTYIDFILTIYWIVFFRFSLIRNKIKVTAHWSQDLELYMKQVNKLNREYQAIGISFKVLICAVGAAMLVKAYQLVMFYLNL